MGYSTDVSDAEWELLAPFLERKGKPGRPQKYSMRSIVNASLYVLHGGIKWEMLPNDFPPYAAVFWHFNRCRKNGTWQHILNKLRGLVRKMEGRDPQPTASIVDSQSVKTTRKKGVRRRKTGVRKQAPSASRRDGISAAHHRA